MLPRNLKSVLICDDHYVVRLKSKIPVFVVGVFVNGVENDFVYFTFGYVPIKIASDRSVAVSGIKLR